MKIGDLVKWLDGDIGLITKVRKWHRACFYVEWVNDIPAWHDADTLEVI